MKIRVLGSAAGGGLPQWNCNCPNCDGFRKGTIQIRRRTQSSIAVSSDSVNWVLFNASPDILTQLDESRGLQPGRAIRDTGIRAVVLIDAQIDHTTGLLMLRESKEPLRLYCTDPVNEDLTTGNPLFNVLSHYCKVDRQPQ
jgi:pyrroloquinoline quinone biosynthesis protein B